MSKRIPVSSAQAKALRSIVTEWVSEGFTTPPYTSEQYDIFEGLDITGTVGGYNTTRGRNKPTGTPNFVRLYSHFRSGGIYRYSPRSRSNALYMAWKYWRKGSA